MFWNVLAIPFSTLTWGENTLIFSLSSSTVPVVGLYIPVIRLKTVVFPAPFGPIRPYNSPSLISTLKLLTAFNPPNTIERSVVWIMIQENQF